MLGILGLTGVRALGALVAGQVATKQAPFKRRALENSESFEVSFLRAVCFLFFGGGAGAG